MPFRGAELPLSPCWNFPFEIHGRGQKGRDFEQQQYTGPGQWPRIC